MRSSFDAVVLAGGAGRRWTRVCHVEQLQPAQGATALVDGRQVALFRTFDGAVYGLSNRDPFTGASVLSRGLVGTRGGVPTVTSPLHPRVFDLRTGVCLDEPDVAVPVFDVRVRNRMVEIQA